MNIKLLIKRVLFSPAKILNTNFLSSLIPNIFMIIFFLIPIFLIIKMSFAESIFSFPPISPICQWLHNSILEIRLTFSNYITLINDSYYLSAFLNSLLLTTLNTILCFIIGFPMAYGLAQAPKRTQNVLLTLLSLSFWTATLIRIYAWINILSNQGILNNFLIKLGIIKTPIQFLGNLPSVLLGLLFCYLPYMIFPIYSNLSKLDKEYQEAAYDLGCHPLATFWKITLPLAKHGILTGSILVFSTTIGEFAIPELLGAPDTILFGRLLWLEFFNNLNWPKACALSIFFMILIVSPLFLIQQKFSSSK